MPEGFSRGERLSAAARRAAQRPGRDLALNGHLDVFPVSDGAGWTHDPRAANSSMAASIGVLADKGRRSLHSKTKKSFPWWCALLASSATPPTNPGFPRHPRFNRGAILRYTQRALGSSQGARWASRSSWCREGVI